MNQRILLASPVRQRPAILAPFLRGLAELDTTALDVSFAFVDDNTIAESSDLLAQFSRAHPRVSVRPTAPDGDYACDETTHHWSDALIWKVAGFKDALLDDARRGGFDYIFLVDSDLVLPRQLLRHLVSLGKPVVSEVFWTRWQPDSPMLPQVWLSDHYTLFARARTEAVSKDEAIARTLAFLKTLRRPGVVRVGGLGACTLIGKEALAKGVRFAEVDNLSIPGEDRHFCVRARALGVELWADTRYPPLHVYREADLRRVDHYRARFAADFLEKPKLTLSMVVHNEASRWLGDALVAHRGLIDEAVIVDDASTDATVDVVQRALDGIPLRLVRNERSRFSNEVELRKQQWDECVASNPDWILVLDADEILEPRAATVLPDLVRQTAFSLFGFQLYDFWSPTHFREDEWWSAHKTPRPFLVRYTPDFHYMWDERPQHCGRMPANVMELNAAAIDLRVKHMGWSTPGERVRKHARYRELDPGAIHGIRQQYDSILDATPNLVAWHD